MSATLDTELFANYFQNVDHDGNQTRAPILSVPGRTFPVLESYVEEFLAELKSEYDSASLSVLRQCNHTVDYLKAEVQAQNTRQRDSKAAPEPENHNLVPHGLVAAAIAHIVNKTDEGAILVFLPGLEEMQNVEKIMKRDRVLGTDLTDETKFRTYLLHSSIPDTQRSVFDPSPTKYVKSSSAPTSARRPSPFLTSGLSSTLAGHARLDTTT